MELKLRVDIPENEKVTARDAWRGREKRNYLHHRTQVGLKTVTHVREELGLPEFPLSEIPQFVSSMEDAYSTVLDEKVAEASELFIGVNDVTIVVQRNIVESFETIRVDSHKTKTGEVTGISLYHELNWETFLSAWKEAGYPVEWVLLEPTNEENE